MSWKNQKYGDKGWFSPKLLIEGTKLKILGKNVPKKGVNTVESFLSTNLSECSIKVR